MENYELFSASAEETLKIGNQIAASLYLGAVVCLNGELGSGKTYLTKGIASGLGIKEEITSPTYTILNEYPFLFLNGNKKSTLYHIDAYRLLDERDFENSIGQELLSSGGICIIEWSGRISKILPEDAIKIFLEIKEYSSRIIKITGINIS